MCIILDRIFMKNLVVVFLASMIVCGAASCCDDNVIKVSGNAQVKVKPDIAILTVRVENTDESTSDALSGMNQKMAQVITVLAGRNIPEDDYSTSAFRISPQYTYINNVRVLTGQQASQSLTVKIRDLTQDGAAIGLLVEDLSQIGGIILNGVSFEQSDRSLGMTLARQAAYNSAKSKAEEYGQLTGQQVRRVLKIKDVDGGYYQPFFADAEGFSSKIDTVVPVRDVTVSASVDLTFSLGI